MTPDTEHSSSSWESQPDPSVLPGESAVVVQDIVLSLDSGAGVIPILQGISFTVPRQQLQFLMGPSGSGKTTLLQILAGFLRPTSGDVQLLGQSLNCLTNAQLTQFRLRHLGFIFQHFNLFPALNAEENVALALQIKGVRKRELKERAIALLNQVGMAHKADRLPRDLSGGEQQRVAIARALAGDPEIIMADEPTAALDSANGRVVIDLLRDRVVQSGATVLIVTHDFRLLDKHDRVLFLEDGKLLNV
ncbi:ABC transporter ATP-binding protein [Alkalinema sp. FACHB-956]|uniref:ABC transporter ATP-binding protein n=1 Tax=Alkalinema sp. FACHB-956 TaxID=2692768 RepID=UPI0016833750|nr:ABC transporter ATP-binding protein [Alkalinema sp. FACHB-956]MBD2328460.1 ABC transporter ATP-binding protein [Alkalinema sp. FACHB-956]